MDIAADVVIVGGGHNGLTCATYLGQAGLDVVVLERAKVVGGAAITEEFHPGFRNSVASYTVSLLNPKVIADLGLVRHGLTIVERPAANFWPVDAERYLLMPYGAKGRVAAISAFSKRDGERLGDYDRALERAVGLLRDLVLRTPPNAGGGLAEVIRNAGLGLWMLGLDLDDQRLLVDLFTKSVAEFLGSWFESDVVKGAFAFDGIVGAYAGPTTPGTAYVLLHHCFGEVNGTSGMWGHAIGGMGAITTAMAAAAREAGVRIVTGDAVCSIAPAGRGLVLETQSGARYIARCVAANVPPKLLARDLLAEDAMHEKIRQRFLGIRSGSGTFRMNVALSELPDFACLPGKSPRAHHGAGIIIGPTLEYLERAYLDARLTGWSKEPVVELVIPSTIDDSLAPTGKHVASLFVQHVAPRLPGGRDWSDPLEKETFADLVIDTVSRHAPNFKTSVIARQVLSPLDLEQRFGLVDGDIFHGQLGLDQLFSTRPLLGYGNYRMPVEGLYLCGSGAHPGGGVTGVPGHNCAREILRDMKRGRLRR